jgi:hypothetical protein
VTLELHDDRHLPEVQALLAAKLDMR